MSQNQNGAGPSGSKAIANTIKRTESVTRRGSAKMKFVPTLPARRKKEEALPELKPETSAEGTGVRGRGQGRARGRGRGDGRGGGPSGSEMIASGPFALGPTALGHATQRRGAPRSNFAPVIPTGAPSSSSLGSGLTKTTAPSLKSEEANSKILDIDAYSDPDDGVEIIDIDDVRQMDWMAPESLKKEKAKSKKNGSRNMDIQRKGKVKAEPEDGVSLAEPEEENVDLANAIDLSESEEEEEIEDIIHDLALQEDEMDLDSKTRQEKLFFFQFPEPFPTFLAPKAGNINMEANTNAEKDTTTETQALGKGKKAVSFAPGVKPPADIAAPKTDPADAKSEVKPPIDGVIGRLEIRKSGLVQMRLGDEILLDVTAATQTSFLQHAIHLDLKTKQLNVLGEVNKRFVVSPNIESLLESMRLAETQAAMDVDKVVDGMITMEDT